MIFGSRHGNMIAGAWAAMISLGQEGYLEHTREIMEASKRIQQGVKEIPELFIVGRPDMTIVAFGSNVTDIFEVNDILSSKGWHLSPLQRPNSIHICVTLQHVPVVDEFLNDLKDSVQTVKKNPGPISGGLAPIYGAAGKIPDRDFLHVQILKARRTWSMTSFGMKTRREGAQKMKMIELPPAIINTTRISLHKDQVIHEHNSRWSLC
ncbi:putative sphinganine-1-phosphate aldolase [Helianthus annuus]|nr:putative sphinganine-1-phosphate aldolase [Helianthus annuus]